MTIQTKPLSNVFSVSWEITLKISITLFLAMIFFFKKAFLFKFCHYKQRVGLDAQSEKN